MTNDRAVELLRGMQASILNGGRLRSAASSLDQSRVEAMDLAIEAIRQVGSASVVGSEASGLNGAGAKRRND